MTMTNSRSGLRTAAFALFLLGVTPAQSFSAIASGTLFADGSNGSTPRSYSGAFGPTATTVSSGSFGIATAGATLAGNSLATQVSSTGLGLPSASSSVLLTLFAPEDAGVRITFGAVGQGLAPTFSYTVLGQTYTNNGFLVVDALIPPAGLPIQVTANSTGGGFNLNSVDITVAWTYPGVSRTGSPTPGCLGDAVAWTRGIPELANSGFGITCANAHPTFGGVSVIGLGGLSTPFVYDFVNVWVDPNQPLGTLYIPATAGGTMFHPLPLPSHPSYIGLTLFAQWILLEPTGCTPLALSGSNAIQFTVLQ